METRAVILAPCVKRIQTAVSNGKVLLRFGSAGLSRELARVQWESHGGFSSSINTSSIIIETKVKTRRPEAPEGVCLIIITLHHTAPLHKPVGSMSVKKTKTSQAHFENVAVPNYTLSLQFSNPEINLMWFNKNVVFYLGVKAEMMSSLAPVHWRHCSTLFPQRARTQLFPSWLPRWISDTRYAVKKTGQG